MPTREEVEEYLENRLDREGITYGYPCLMKAILFIGMFLGGWFIFLFWSSNVVIVLFFMFFLSLMIWGYVSSLDSVTVTNTKIAARHYFREESLHWSEISRLIPKGGNLILTNVTGDVKIFITSQFAGFSELENFIRQKRPDLFS